MTELCEKNLQENLPEEDDAASSVVQDPSAQLPVAFQEKRHVDTIAGGNAMTHTWRMKERVSHESL